MWETGILGEHALSVVSPQRWNLTIYPALDEPCTLRKTFYFWTPTLYLVLSHATPQRHPNSEQSQISWRWEQKRHITKTEPESHMFPNSVLVYTKLEIPPHTETLWRRGVSWEISKVAARFSGMEERGLLDHGSHDRVKRKAENWERELMGPNPSLPTTLPCWIHPVIPLISLIHDDKRESVIILLHTQPSIHATANLSWTSPGHTKAEEC